MKRREVQRESELLRDCSKARTTTNEYGENDDRVFCYGLFSPNSVYKIDAACKLCGAYVYNAKPLEGVTE